MDWGVREVVKPPCRRCACRLALALGAVAVSGAVLSCCMAGWWTVEAGSIARAAATGDWAPEGDETAGDDNAPPTRGAGL